MVIKFEDKRGRTIPWANTIVESATSCHDEIIDTRTLAVWQALEPSTVEVVRGR